MKRCKNCKKCIWYYHNGYADMGFHLDTCWYMSFVRPFSYDDIIESNVDYTFNCEHYIERVELFNNIDAVKELLKYVK